MKKVLSIIIVLIMIAAVSLTAVSCSSGNEEGGGAVDRSVVGNWETVIDYKSLFSAAGDDESISGYESIGVDISSCGVTLLFELKSNGRMTVSVDSNATEEDAEALFGEVFDKKLDASGKTEEEFLASMNYESKEDAVKDMINNTDFSFFNGEAIEFSADNGTLAYNDTKIKYTVEDGKLTLEEVLSESEKNVPYAFIEYHLPMELTKKQ